MSLINVTHKPSNPYYIIAYTVHSQIFIIVICIIHSLPTILERLVLLGLLSGVLPRQNTYLYDIIEEETEEACLADHIEECDTI